VTAIEYMCTKLFGVDSSNRFHLRARTNRQTDATERPTHANSYTVGMGNKHKYTLLMLFTNLAHNKQQRYVM